MQKDTLYRSQKLVNKEIMDMFKENYPNIEVEDYRPLCPQLFTANLQGVTIWLKNGDIIQYYPHQRLDKESIYANNGRNGEDLL